MAEGLIIDGKIWPLLTPPWMQGAGIPIPVFGWRDKDVKVPEFRAGDGYNKARTKEINWGVYHWTGGERDPIDMAETLRKYELGIETAVDIYGHAFQFCDPCKVDTADAGYLNAGSYGVEIVNFGFRRVLTARHVFLSRRAKSRGHETVRYRGKNRKIAKFFPRQITTAIAIADVMCRALDIPRTVPLQPDGGDVRLGLMTRKEVEALPGGNIAHYMLSKRKLDPGPTLMRAIRDGLQKYDMSEAG